MAVQISVLDKDPQMAADIANTVAALLDSVKNDMQRQRAIRPVDGPDVRFRLAVRHQMLAGERTRRNLGRDLAKLIRVVDQEVRPFGRIVHCREQLEQVLVKAPTR